MTIDDVVRERGPMTVAAFMDLALYDPQLGYYARAARRSGRGGDFITSVDAGPIFGELLAAQLAEMFSRLAGPSPLLPVFVEAGAGDGRLTADILDALLASSPDLYARLRVHLVERSAAARTAQRDVLAAHAGRIASSGDALPVPFEGVLVANELLDAMPVHQVVMTRQGLRELYVSARGLCDGPLSTAALADYFDRLDLTLDIGQRADVNLNALAWIRAVGARLRRGFLILIDYGHEARDLYSPARAAGTLRSFGHHRVSDAVASSSPGWLRDPGARDLTSSVDFTSVRAAAEDAGLTAIALLDQTYFLLGLLSARPAAFEDDRRRRALKTLLMPGGIGSTHKVLILGKGVGAPRLAGTSAGARLT